MFGSPFETVPASRLEPLKTVAPASAIPNKKKPHRDKRGNLLVLPSGRMAEGRRLREFRADLIAHCGGRPSAVQQTLIDRATVLQHQLTTYDRRAKADGGLSDHATRVYLAWQNTLTRTLLAIGLDARHARAPTPQEALATVRARLAGGE